MGLEKLKGEIPGKNDLIASEEQAEGVASILPFSQNKSKNKDAFQLKDRGDLLAQLDDAPIVVHAAKQANQKLPFEKIFRSENYQLMSAITSE